MAEGSERGGASVSPVVVDDIMARWARREAQEAQLLPVNKTNISQYWRLLTWPWC